MALPNFLKVYLYFKLIPSDIKKNIIKRLNNDEIEKINFINKTLNNIQIPKYLYFIVAREIINYKKFNYFFYYTINIIIIILFILLLYILYALGITYFGNYFIGIIEYGGLHFIIFMIYLFFNGTSFIFNLINDIKKINIFISISIGVIILPFLLIYNIYYETKTRIDFLFFFYLFSSITYVPFIEELYFRKFIFDIFKNKYISIFISSILFSLAHNPENIISGIIIFFCGLLLSISYNYGKLPSSFISHSVSNFLNIMFGFIKFV